MTNETSLPATMLQVRRILSAAFPDTRFSATMKRYSMGASVNVSWTDGPTKMEVREAVKSVNNGWLIVTHRASESPMQMWPDGQIRPEEPYQCGAFMGQEQCLLLSDHEYQHIFRKDLWSTIQSNESSWTDDE